MGQAARVDDYTDLDAYLALPRTAGLALSPDGTRLVTVVATLDAKAVRWVSALWEVDPGEVETLVLRAVLRWPHVGPRADQRPTANARSGGCR